MKTYKHLYEKIISLNNLTIAWKKARKGKTAKEYVIEFEKNLNENLRSLRQELLQETYLPQPLKTFIIRDPKTRVISKSEFKDRIVHHAIVNILEPIYEIYFIHDSCANRKRKGTLFALRRFDVFKRKVSKNGKQVNNGYPNANFVQGYCLKADIRKYFDTVDHEVLIKLLKRRIKDKQTISLIKKIIFNFHSRKGMPLGNLTSQFFANIYLHEFDLFVKHVLKAKHYIRYVDDFVILHRNKRQLDKWKERINNFLITELKIELHPEKSKIIPLALGVDFVGFRSFYHYKLLRKRNIKSMRRKIGLCKEGVIIPAGLCEIYQGWQAYARWADTYKLRQSLVQEINSLQR